MYFKTLTNKKMKHIHIFYNLNRIRGYIYPRLSLILTFLIGINYINSQIEEIQESRGFDEERDWESGGYRPAAQSDSSRSIFDDLVWAKRGLPQLAKPTDRNG